MKFIPKECYFEVPLTMEHQKYLSKFEGKEYPFISDSFNSYPILSFSWSNKVGGCIYFSCYYEDILKAKRFINKLLREMN